MQNLYNLTFERVVLSHILFSIDPVNIENALLNIKSEFFYLPSHRDIYDAMLSLYHSNKPIDEEFLKIELDKRKKFDESVMLDIMSANPIANISSYIKQVHEYYVKRKLIELSFSIKNIVFDENSTIDSAISNIDNNLVNIISTNSKSSDFGIVSICDIPDGETKFILRNWMPFPVGTVSMVGAPGGTGKSWTALQIGFRFLSENKTSKVALWLSEDPDYQTRARAKAIAKDILNTTLSEYRNAHIINARPEQIVVNGKLDYARFLKMKKALKGYDLVVLDPLRVFYGGDENSNTEANVFMNALQDWAAEDGIVIVLMHHSKKNDNDTIKSKVRGASAFVDACRTVYEISKVYKNARTGELDMDNQHMRQFVLTKDNYGAIILLNNNFKIMRQITPLHSARITAFQVENTYTMPII